MRAKPDIGPPFPPRTAPKRRMRVEVALMCYISLRFSNRGPLRYKASKGGLGLAKYATQTAQSRHSAPLRFRISNSRKRPSAPGCSIRVILIIRNAPRSGVQERSPLSYDLRSFRRKPRKFDETVKGGEHHARAKACQLRASPHQLDYQKCKRLCH